MNIRIGLGEDAHKLEAGRALVVGGVEITSERGAAAHSDGDVLLHALADALLSGLALGDIGLYFPPSHPDFKNLDSADIVRRILSLLGENSETFYVKNVALVVTLDTPKLGTYREAMQRRVADLLGVAPQAVGIGFKTSEGLAPDHIQASATVLLEVGP